MLKRLMSLVISVLGISTLHAAQDAEVAQAVQEAVLGEFNYGKELSRVFGSLGLLIALVIVTVYVLKRFLRSRQAVVNQSSQIKILERRNLTQKAAVYLLEVEGKGILISDSPGGVKFLCEVELAKQSEPIGDRQIAASFATNFKSFIKKKLLRAESRDA